jgi:glyoxylase-like metal-dependent hydrolase (beta-lactamase superfamily II)
LSEAIQIELKKITDNVFYIPDRVNVGVITYDKKSILIDSGLDADAGKKILKTLEENGLFLNTIINTHSHADHCGGNSYIKEKTGAIVYASEIEAEIIQAPYLEPFYLFSGAAPPKNLKNRFLMAPPSIVDNVLKSTDEYVLNDKIRIVRLPGHSPNQIGIESENILFCADSVFSEDVLKKHKIPFCTDVEKQKATLAFLKNSKYKYYVPCHAEPTDNIAHLADANLRAMTEIEDSILKILIEKKTTEDIIKSLCKKYEIEVKDIQQYYLTNTTVLAYLSALNETQKLKMDIDGNMLYWERL